MHVPDKVADRGQDIAGHLGDGSVGDERDAVGASVAVFDDGVVGVEVEGNDERAGAVGGGERRGFPAAGGEAKGGVLELRFGWRQRDGELPEDLGVGVQGVAGVPPCFVRQCWPGGRHASAGRRGHG